MRYILFAGVEYYPLGGFNDVKGWSDSIDSLRDSEALKAKDIDWWHIYDTEKRGIIESRRLSK